MKLFVQITKYYRKGAVAGESPCRDLAKGALEKMRKFKVLKDLAFMPSYSLPLAIRHLQPQLSRKMAVLSL